MNSLKVDVEAGNALQADCTDLPSEEELSDSCATQDEVDDDTSGVKARVPEGGPDHSNGKQETSKFTGNFKENGSSIGFMLANKDFLDEITECSKHLYQLFKTLGELRVKEPPSVPPAADASDCEDGRTVILWNGSSLPTPSRSQASSEATRSEQDTTCNQSRSSSTSSSKRVCCGTNRWGNSGCTCDRSSHKCRLEESMVNHHSSEGLRSEGNGRSRSNRRTPRTPANTIKLRCDVRVKLSNSSKSRGRASRLPQLLEELVNQLLGTASATKSHKCERCISPESTDDGPTDSRATLHTYSKMGSPENGAIDPQNDLVEQNFSKLNPDVSRACDDQSGTLQNTLDTKSTCRPVNFKQNAEQPDDSKGKEDPGSSHSPSGARKENFNIANFFQCYRNLENSYRDVVKLIDVLRPDEENKRVSDFISSSPVEACVSNYLLEDTNCCMSPENASEEYKSFRSPSECSDPEKTPYLKPCELAYERVRFQLDAEGDKITELEPVDQRGFTPKENASPLE